MTKTKLTPKQEKFVQNVFKGMSQREAYKDSYNVKKMTDNAIDREASVLFKSPKVSQRYQELQEKVEKDTIMTAKERMEWLSKVINGEIKEKISDIKTDDKGKAKVIEIEIPSKLDTKLKALDSLNKMTGEYTTKIEGDVSLNKKLEDIL